MIKFEKGVINMIKLKELRQRNNIKQKDICKILNVSDATIGHWETGKREPDIKALIKLSEYFNVSVDFLINNKPREPTIININTNLSDTEKDLIEQYKRLPNECKIKVKGYIDGLTEQIKIYTKEN